MHAGLGPMAEDSRAIASRCWSLYFGDLQGGHPNAHLCIAQLNAEIMVVSALPPIWLMKENASQMQLNEVHQRGLMPLPCLALLWQAARRLRLAGAMGPLTSRTERGRAC